MAHYEIQVREVGAAEPSWVNAGDVLSYNSTSLDSGTEYEARVRRVEDEVASDPTAWVQVTTNTTVVTLSPSLVRGTTAKFNGELTDMTGQAAIDCYFQYKIAGAGSWSDTSANKEELTAVGEFSYEISGLTENESYDVRAVAEWDDGGTQNAYGDTETFNTFWVREGSQEDFERGILSGVEVVNDKLQLITDGESGTRQKPYKITNTESEITWTATTPTDTTLAIEAQVKGTTAITDEAVGTGDGTTKIFTLDHWPADTPAIKVDGVAETGFTLGNDRRTITFDTAPADTHVILASYTAVDDSQDDEPEIQELGLGCSAGGTFKLGDGTTWTSDIDYDASAATIETALEGLYGAGNVGVTEDTGIFTVTFAPSVGNSGLVADFTGLT